MKGRRSNAIVLPSGASVGGRRRRSRRRHPLLVLTAIVVAVGGLAWLWYSVFHPLFADPRDWVARQRAYRKMISEVVTGATGDAPPAPKLPSWPPPPTPDQVNLVGCAEAQVARGVKLSTRYHPMTYPWGDLPEHLGSSPDIVVRCLRAVGLDVQQMLHIDRVRHPRRFPLHLWSSRRPDTSIDHRRLANLAVFLEAFGDKRPVATDSPEKLADFLPGDVVFWTTASGGEHPGLVGFVLDRRDADGVPLMVTLLPEERRVTDSHGVSDWTVTGRIRVVPERLLERFFEENPQARLAAREPAGGG